MFVVSTVGRLRMAVWPYFLQGLKGVGGKFYIFAPSYKNGGLKLSKFPKKEGLNSTILKKKKRG